MCFASLVVLVSKGGGADGPYRRAGEQRRRGRYATGLDTEQAGVGKGTYLEKVHASIIVAVYGRACFFSPV